MINYKTSKQWAFTLAETLIVIGIIGVVAALTLPNLNHATGDKEKVTKVKKIYSALTDAFDRAEAIYGPIDEWFKTCGEPWSKECNKILGERFVEFLKVSKNCEFDKKGCFSEAPLYWADGDERESNYFEGLKGQNAYMVTMPDGVSVAFVNYDPLIRFRIDIDGPNKGKNKEELDIFEFTIGLYEADKESLGYRELVPDIKWTNEGYYEGEDENGDSQTYCYIYGTNWIIQNGNMDYLKCPEELDWKTQTSCK